MDVFAACAADLLAGADGLRAVRKFNKIGAMMARYELHCHGCLGLFHIVFLFYSSPFLSSVLAALLVCALANVSHVL